MSPPTSRDVLAAVGAAFEVEPSVFTSRSRTEDAIRARWAAALLLGEVCGLRPAQIDRRLQKAHPFTRHVRRASAQLGPAFWGRLEAARAQLGEGR